MNENYVDFLVDHGAHLGEFRLKSKRKILMKYLEKNNLIPTSTKFHHVTDVDESKKKYSIKRKFNINDEYDDDDYNPIKRKLYNENFIKKNGSDMNFLNKKHLHDKSLDKFLDSKDNFYDEEEMNRNFKEVEKELKYENIKSKYSNVKISLNQYKDAYGKLLKKYETQCSNYIAMIKAFTKSKSTISEKNLELQKNKNEIKELKKILYEKEKGMKQRRENLDDTIIIKGINFLLFHIFI